MAGSGARKEARSLGYEFALEREARDAAGELDRRFDERELAGLRIYRVRWNGKYIVEARFSEAAPESRLRDARALLGESGAPVHPDDLEDYQRATEADAGGVPGWIRRLLGRDY